MLLGLLVLLRLSALTSFSTLSRRSRILSSLALNIIRRLDLSTGLFTLGFHRLQSGFKSLFCFRRQCVALVLEKPAEDAQREPLEGFGVIQIRLELLAFPVVVNDHLHLAADYRAPNAPLAVPFFLCCPGFLWATCPGLPWECHR